MLVPSEVASVRSRGVDTRKRGERVFEDVGRAVLGRIAVTLVVSSRNEEFATDA